jgi:hypothetical protein
MEPSAFSDDPGVNREKAAKDLLHHRRLSTSCGEQAEYEIQTIISATRPAWRYRCSVLFNGTEVREKFPPIYVDRTSAMSRERELSEEMRLAFALEAVEAHYAMHAKVLESLPPPSRPSIPKLRPVFLVSLGAAVLLLAAYYVFRPDLVAWWSHHDNGSVGVSSQVQWDRTVVSLTLQSGQEFMFPLPPLEMVPKDLPVTVVLDPPNDRLNWLTFDVKTLRISGKAPVTDTDITHKLVFRAKAKAGLESILHFELLIKGRSSQPTPHPSEDCIVKRLRGEPCL